MTGKRRPAKSGAERQREYRERQNAKSKRGLVEPRDSGLARANSHDRLALSDSGCDLLSLRGGGNAGGGGPSRRSRGQKNRHRKPPSLFDRGQFIAIDGEGFSEGPTRKFVTDGGEYEGQEHFYAYLADSDGFDLYSPTRLDTFACLDFLCAIRERNPKGIVVCFGGGYDVCQMLAHGLTREQIQELCKGGDIKKPHRYLDLEGPNYDYRLEYRPRKSFTIKRWDKGAPKYRNKAKGDGRTLAKHLDVTVWDVWGFFQDSFAGVMRKWVPDDPDYKLIEIMKAERSVFSRDNVAHIARYNAAELRCLVAVMVKVRDAVKALGLSLNRWDGAGAIAAAMNKLHNVKAHMAQPPQPVFEAARHAYSGGHIEACKLGRHTGPIYHYDVNSAYPSVYTTLPSLAEGTWKHGTGKPPNGFTLVNVSFEFAVGMPFYPLFWRGRDGSIVYPRKGRGWYWMPEYMVAEEFAKLYGAAHFVVHEWWHLVCVKDVRPFGWVQDYYNRRQQLVAETKRTGVDTGEEKIIKLGLNSLYGKTAQQVGARFTQDGLRLPSYFQLEWAGYVTSGCRAQLMQAAIQNPRAIISFATDGLFSLEPLNLHAPKEKVLGAWEAQTHTGITMVMPGVYWLHDGEKLTNYSRGFDKKAMSDTDMVIAAWKRRLLKLPVGINRLIGLGSAAQSETYWQMRGMFVKSWHALAMDGSNSKRWGVSLSTQRPHQGMVDVAPRDQPGAWELSAAEMMSAPYPVAWIKDGARAETTEADRQAEGEELDAQLAETSADDPWF